MMKRLGFALVILAFGQFGFVGYRILTSEPSLKLPSQPGRLSIDQQVDSLTVARLSTSDTLSSLHLRRDDDRWTVLLAFSANCVYCDEHAATWGTWLDARHPMLVYGITRDSGDVAAQYRIRHRWNLTIVRAPNRPSGTVESLLTGRTPWIYLFDATGVLRFEGHGAGLPRLDSIYRRLERGPVALAH